MIWVAGGPVASLITGGAALFACRAESVGGDARIGLPVAAFAILSLLVGIQSLRNGRFRGYATDGALLGVLSSSYDGARQQIAAHALHMLENKAWDASLWNRRWIYMASLPSELHTTSFHSDWLQYHLSDGPDRAAECLERSLAGLALLPPDQREENSDQVFLEAAWFMAWHRDDARKAQIWFDRVSRPDRVSPLLQKRMQVALSYAHRDFDKAIDEIDKGLVLLNQLPAGTRVDRLRSSWQEWQSIIRTKRDHTASILEQFQTT